MKTLILTTLVLFITLTAQAQTTLEATSVQDLVKLIQSEQLVYKETGKIFGYDTTHSCLFVSENVAIFKNYCYPVKPYPARGYTIISKEFGMIDLYEEKLTSALKRDIRITEFPKVLAPYLSTSFPEATLNGISAMIQKLYFQHNPACWSTNYSFYTKNPEVNCTVSADHVLNAQAWADETQSIVLDQTTWLALMDAIEAKLVR